MELKINFGSWYTWLVITALGATLAVTTGWNEDNRVSASFVVWTIASLVVGISRLIIEADK